MAKKIAKNVETKSVTVLVRLTEDQALRLDQVQQMSPALSSRPAAVRRLLDLMTEEETEVGDAAAGKEPVVSAADAVLIRASIKERTKSYNAAARQLSAIGSNMNQIARAENTLARSKVAGHVNQDFLDSIQRDIAVMRDRISVLAHQDSFLDTWLS